jgi:RNA polymerase sigma factor for flagellar operon FliA
MRTDDEFVSEYEGLVRDIAFRIHNQFRLTCELDDLTGFGYSGLLEARERYDATKGVKFKSFAYYRIRGAIIDGVRKMAYLPRRAYARLCVAEALDAECESVGEARAASPGLRADLAGTVRAVDSILGHLAASCTVANAAEEQEGLPDESPEEAMMARERRSVTLQAIEALPERERLLVRGFYLEERTLDDLARQLGISKSWASRVHSKAIDRLKAVLGDSV